MSSSFYYNSIVGEFRPLPGPSAASVKNEGTIYLPGTGTDYDPNAPGIDQDGDLTVLDMDGLSASGYNTRPYSYEDTFHDINPRPSMCPEMKIFNFKLKANYLPILIYELSGAITPENIDVFSLSQKLKMFFSTYTGEKLHLVLDLKKTKFIDLQIAEVLFTEFSMNTEHQTFLDTNCSSLCILQPNEVFGKSVRGLLSLLSVLWIGKAKTNIPFKIVNHNREVDEFIRHIKKQH